jgi:hypothetical protein
MQNGSHSNTGGLASTHVLRTSGGLGTDAGHDGAQGRDGLGAALIRSDDVIRGRSNRRSGASGDRLPGSGRVGHDLSDAAKEVGVNGMAGSGTRGSLSGLRAGPGSLSYASSADSRDHGALGASEIHLQFTLRLGQEQCSHTRSGRANGGKVAQVIVFRDTRPATGAIRAWTHLHPHGINLHHTRLPDGARMDLIDDTNLANEDGTRDTVPAVIRAAKVKAERDKEASGGIHDGALPTPALKRRRGDTSMPGGRQVLIGGGAHLTQPYLRAERGVRLASQRTWEVQCRSFRAEVLVLSGGLRVVCSNGFIARVCSKEANDGLILFRIFGECLCERQSQSGSG